eukprot:scaffold651394_cov41-Prasinocladus_malaysianus.AAC.1
MLVEEGRWYSCNRLEVSETAKYFPFRLVFMPGLSGRLMPLAMPTQAEPGSKIQLGRVIAYRNESDFTVGQPYLEGVNVEAEVVEELKGPKVLVYKMKPKKHYRRMAGHRQPLTKFKVTKIAA